MNISLDLLRCPITKTRLHWQDDSTLCTEQGDRRYPVVLGIPDFRLFDPPYQSRAKEQQQAEQLAEAAERLDYNALIHYYEETLCGQGLAERTQRQITHRLALRQRAPQRLYDMLEMAGVSRLPGDGLTLDLGCGSGEALAALHELRGMPVIGLDISLIELVFARQLLAEQGITATLVAGCGEALPFADQTFSFIYSPDVIEHVSDQRRYLQEGYRVLAANGTLLLNSPNRFSVVCPEPHVGIWGLGFLPRALMDPCCRLLGKGPYVGKRLVSLNELRQLVRTTFDQFVIKSRESNPQANSLPGRLYHALSPLSVNLFAHVCDQHVVLANKRG